MLDLFFQQDKVVTWTEFTFPPRTTWVRDTEHQEAQDSDHWYVGNKQGHPLRVFELAAYSFQRIVQGDGTQVESGHLRKLRRWSWESRDAKVARVHSTEYQRDSYIDRKLRKSEEDPTPLSLQLSTDQQIHMGNNPRPGMGEWRQTEKGRGNNTRITQVQD